MASSGSQPPNDSIVEHNADMDMPDVPATVSAEDFAKMSAEWTAARKKIESSALEPRDFDLLNDIAASANVKTESANVKPGFKTETSKKPKIPPRFVPSVTNQPPYQFFEFDGLVVKYENRGTVSRAFGPRLDVTRFGPDKFQLGTIVCDGCSTVSGEIIEIIEHPQLGTIFRVQWFDKSVGAQRYDGCFYPRSQLRMKTTGKREIDENYYIPLPEVEKRARVSRTSVIAVDRTFLSGWTDSDMGNFKPKDKVYISGVPCRVTRNDRTNRALVVHETDEFGSPLYPLLDRDAECDDCMAYYEDVDLKTAENARRKFKLRPGATSSVSTAKSTIEEAELLDPSADLDIGPQADHAQPEQLNLVVPKKQLKSTQRQGATVDATENVQIASSSNISADDFAALVKRIRELEQENSQLKTNTVVLQLEEARNEKMINHFVQTMAKIAHNFNNNSAQQKIQTDRLEDIGIQFSNQGRELARCKNQIMQENKNDLERMGDTLQSKLLEARGIDSHELLASARHSSLHKQMSGLTPMTSPAHFTPSPKAGTSTKRSLVPSMDRSSAEPLAKKIDLGVEQEPLFSGSTISNILSKHGQTEALRLVVDEVEQVVQSDENSGETTAAVQNTPVLPKPTSAKALRPIKNLTEAWSMKLRPQSYTSSPGKTEAHTTEAVPPKIPTVPMRVTEKNSASESFSDKVRGYMKEIDRHAPNGFNPDCMRPFDFHGDPVYRDDAFKLVYLPLCLAALNLDPGSAANEILAAHFFLENVDLPTYGGLPKEYQEKELSRHLKKCGPQFFASKPSYPVPYAEEKVHHLYPFQRNVYADLSLHTLLHAWVNNCDEDDDDDTLEPDYTPQQQKQGPSSANQQQNAEPIGEQNAEPIGEQMIGPGGWPAESDDESEEGGANDTGGDESEAPDPEMIVLKDSKEVKLGGGGMNKVVDYPGDDEFLEGGVVLPLEMTINQFMEKARNGKLITYVQPSVVQNICKSCLSGVKGKEALKAWQSCFSQMCVHILSKNPPRGYWHNHNGVVVVDRELFKDALIKSRGYLKAVVKVKEMVPARFSIHDVQELHYLAARHFDFVFEMFKHLRNAAKNTDIKDFPKANTYKFYLDVLDNARRNLNKRKSEAKTKVVKNEPNEVLPCASASGSSKKARSALAAELDCL